MSYEELVSYFENRYSVKMCGQVLAYIKNVSELLPSCIPPVAEVLTCSIDNYIMLYLFYDVGSAC